ncbi:dihydrolipoyl dehydrogenase family protein [Marinimicrococcus flavescens]|uniref:NAD(P)/FAD-dependent oxidoreductase n=1 Tax=Marinimicrococcus flavescens TaxID=3031815 RepID=A0AAP3XT30_9PROT|nr:NAD(P)/FAD-dependent oxidoreductase [Marinimicrococcus flavescens]
MQEFDLVVIGSGTAATGIATRCREAGWSVAVVDRLPYGGTCPLRGCDPKKMLRRGAEIVDAVRRFEGKGVVARDLRIDWPALMEFKRGFTETVPPGREKRFEDAGIATFHASARFLDRTTLQVGEERLRFRRCAIAAGAEPRRLAFSGAELLTTSDRFMELERLPRRILFVGGGYVSFELAHLAARAGAQVTVLNSGPRPLPAFDPDLVDMLVERTCGLGIAFHSNAEAEAVERAGEGFEVKASVEGATRTFEADLVVHGAGRVPALADLALEKAGIEGGETGVAVNAFLQSTSNEAVYAAGDAVLAGGPPLTPVAGLEAKVVAANLLAGNREKPDYSGVPSAVFTIPALARVGLLESEAREQGLDLTCTFSDMRDWFSIRRTGETHAAAKVLVEKGTDRILGAHLLGPDAGDLVNIFAIAIRSSLRACDLRDYPSAYPTAASDVGSML